MLDVEQPRGHHPAMRSRGRMTKVTSSLLLALTLALGTGLPHHHGHSEHHDQFELVSQDTHHHSSQIVEQDERAPNSLRHVLPARPVRIELVASVVRPPAAPAEDVARPMVRAPPPSSPRAPPFLTV